MGANPVFAVVFWSSLFGALAWLPFFTPLVTGSLHVDLFATTLRQQAVILIKGLAMTFSWVFAYFSIRELPMSFSGAVRASGPLWTMAGGLVVFGELLTPLQITAVLASILAYYLLSRIGSTEGISVLRSVPLAMMLIATILSAMTTVYDKYIVQQLGLVSSEIQAWSAVHRCVLAGALFLVASYRSDNPKAMRWSVWVPLTGLSWVAAEWIYFLAIADPAANVTYLSIFRRVSLVVGFLLSVLLIGEKNVSAKAIVIILIVLSTVTLIIGD
jgi:bacterial/archaeal transporter family protein